MSDPAAPFPQTRLPQTRRRAAFWLLVTVTTILVISALRALAAVAITVLFALFITLVMHPLDARVARAMPRRLGWLGRAAVMGVLLLVLALFLGGLVYAARAVMDEMPRITDELSGMLPGDMLGIGAEEAGAEEAGAGEGARHAPRLPDWLGRTGSAFGEWLTGLAGDMASGVVNTTGRLVAFTVLVFFLVLLALGEVPLWRAKVAALSGDRGGATLDEVIATTARKLRRFLLVRAITGVVSAALYVGWLALFGIDLLIVWAVLTFLLTFIPNIGSVISGTLPALYAFVAVDLGTALAVAAGLFVIEQAIGNFLDPKLQGRTILLSPVVILVAILFWGWLWGIAGAFLAVPVTAALLTIAAEAPALRPFALFLSNQKDEESLVEALRE